MGCLQKCIILCQTTQNLNLILLFLLIFLAEGREMPIKVLASHVHRSMGEEKIVKMRYLIGSFPPRCDKMRCVSCDHCKAVQVPILPRIKHYNLKAEDGHHLQFYEKAPTIAYSRGDGISNYKPMCWKCKCGDFLFDP